MIKFLLIIFFIFYVLIKVGGFIMKTLFSGFSNNQQSFNRQQSQKQYKKPSDGNINIDFIPGSEKSKTEKKNFPGGDYVDYEDV